MSVLDEVMSILDPTDRLALAVNMTGREGFMARENLPEGWATVSYFFRPGSDEPTDYHGPVLKETELSIQIEIHGERLTLPKQKCYITRALVPA